MIDPVQLGGGYKTAPIRNHIFALKNSANEVIRNYEIRESYSDTNNIFLIYRDGKSDTGGGFSRNPKVPEKYLLIRLDNNKIYDSVSLSEVIKIAPDLTRKYLTFESYHSRTNRVLYIQ